MSISITSMQSIIIASRDKNATNSHIQNFCQKQDINPFDISVIEQEKAIGIEIVRIIQKTIYLTPMKSKLKAVVIKNAETLTIEAQNALLKILEEPPPAVNIILQTSNIDSLLPTVLSRCKIIGLDTKQNQYSEKELEENQKVLDNLMSAGIGERLKLAQDAGTTKEQALAWLEKMIIVAREKLLSNIETPNNIIRQELRELISQLQKTYAIIEKTNVNTRFILENMLLSLK